MVNIELNEYEKHRNYFIELSKLKLQDIVWTRDGEIVIIPPGTIDDWKYTGLDNRYFPVYNGLLHKE